MCDKKADEKPKVEAPPPPSTAINHEEAFQLACLNAKDSNMARCYLELRRLVFTGRAVVADFMPNIGSCALQDYGRLNQFMLETDRLWACTPKKEQNKAA